MSEALAQLNGDILAARSEEEQSVEVARILIVDDEPEVRFALSSVLERAGHHCQAAASALTADTLLDEDDFELALCDLRLPGESGLELVEHVLRRHSNVAAVVITGRDEPDLAADLFRLGAYGYLVKPFTPSELLIEVAGALTRRRQELEERVEREGLERAIGEYRTELAVLEGCGESDGEGWISAEKALRCLACAVELRSGKAGAHSERVSAYSELIARELGLGAERCGLIRVASQLHDIGKLAVPDTLLLKNGPLTAEERAIMERHAELGYEILSAAWGSELLRLAATIALTHHERFDGQGYPRGLAGDAIPLEGRIVAIADVFDALTSERPYRPAMSVEAATARLMAEEGHAFDPVVLDAFLGSLDDVLELRARTAKTVVSRDPSLVL